MNNLPPNVRVVDLPYPGAVVHAGAITPYSALGVPAYYRAMQFLSGNLASFPRSVRKNGTPIDTDHPLDPLFDLQPNPLQDAATFWSTLFFHAAHMANGIAEIIRDADYKPVALMNIRPECVYPVRFDAGDGNGLQQFYVLQGGRILFAADVIHLSRLSTYVQQLFDRLTEGADQPVLFLPFVGEFGHEVMSHLRIVHFHQAKHKVVCCRPGDEVLYPSAAEYITDWRDPVSDAVRCGTGEDRTAAWASIVHRYPGHYVHNGATGLDRDQEMFAIRPDSRINFTPHRRGLQADIVFGIRHRQFVPEKNWHYWANLAAAAKAAGLAYAVIGHRATSIDLNGQVCHSGDLDTDAAVELLQNCALYVGTDSGGSHLASTVGANMLLFRETASGMRDFIPRMKVVNPGRIHFMPKVWNDPNKIAADMIGLAETAVLNG